MHPSPWLRACPPLFSRSNLFFIYLNKAIKYKSFFLYIKEVVNLIHQHHKSKQLWKITSNFKTASTLKCHHALAFGFTSPTHVYLYFFVVLDMYMLNVKRAIVSSLVLKGVMGKILIDFCSKVFTWQWYTNNKLPSINQLLKIGLKKCFFFFGFYMSTRTNFL